MQRFRMMGKILLGFVLADSLYREAVLEKEEKITCYKPLKQGDVSRRVTSCQDRWAASAACILLPAETIIQPGARLGIDALGPHL